MKASIALTGLQNAGKTSFTKRLLTDRFTTQLPTYGVDVEYINYQGYPLQIWDMGGHMAFRNRIWENYVKKMSGLIFMVDASDLSTIDESSEWFWKTLSWVDKKDTPILFLVNKSDLVTNKDTLIEEIVLRFKLDKFTKETSPIPFKMFFCSVKTGAYVMDAIHWLIKNQFPSEFQPSIPIASFDMILDGGGSYFVHIYDSSIQRNQTQYLIKTYLSTLFQKMQLNSNFNEERMYSNICIKILTDSDKGLLITSTNKRSNYKVFSEILQKLHLPKSYDTEEMCKLIAFLKKELNKNSLSNIAASLVCKVHSRHLSKSFFV